MADINSQKLKDDKINDFYNKRFITKCSKCLNMVNMDSSNSIQLKELFVSTEA